MSMTVRLPIPRAESNATGPGNRPHDGDSKRDGPLCSNLSFRDVSPNQGLLSLVPV